ncbi:MAG: response regulator transcription factor [Pseudomonadota bacterium]|nr:response regulator transcription factor [Pseudomonadota bacterium]
MNVLVVDDHPLFRQGLAALLHSLDAKVIVIEAGTVREAVAASKGGSVVDLVMLDMGLPDLSRIDALRSVKEVFEGTPIVVMSADEDPALMRAAIEAGASGYVPKTTDAALTVNALRVVLTHGIYLPAHLLLSAPRERSPMPADDGSVPHLSERQTEVLCSLLQGKSNKVIARELGIAEGTVKAHLWAIYQMLGVTSRTMAMFRAQELGLLRHATLRPATTAFSNRTDGSST